MNPNRAIAILIVLAFILVVTVCGAMVFNSYLEAREAKQRDEYADRMVSAVEKATEKIPDFKLLNRKSSNANPSYDHPVLLRRFSD